MNTAARLLRYRCGCQFRTYSSGATKPSAEGTRILNTYTDKIKSKARQEGVSVNNLIQQTVPRDEVQHTRRVESQVSSWRQKYRRDRGNTVFVSVPWLNKDKGDSSQK